jgi:hypothetical protein
MLTSQNRCRREGVAAHIQQIRAAAFENRQCNDEILTCMQDRVLHGRSSSEFQVKSITAADIKATARRLLPSYKGAYVRLATVGQ